MDDEQSTKADISKERRNLKAPWTVAVGRHPVFQPSSRSGEDF